MDAGVQEALRQELAAFNLDLAIDLGEGAESRPLLLLSGAPFLVGFKDRNFPWLTVGFDFNGHDAIDRTEIMPPARKILALVESLGAMLTPTTGMMRDAALDRSRLAAFGLSADRPYAVLHAGARLAYTRWPHFATLARLLIAQTDLTVVLFDEDTQPARDLEGEVEQGRFLRLAGQLKFQDFDTLLSHCAVFVGNDSGPKHLAALRGVPVVGLHMARLNWSEWGQERTGFIISRRVPCAGCGIGEQSEDCAKDFACLRHIQPEEVLQVVQACR